MTEGTVRIVDWSDGSVRDRLDALEGTEWTEELGGGTEARLRVPRADAAALTLDIGDDELFLNTPQYGDEFGGRLVDVRWRGETAVLVGFSFEKDAEDASPAGDGTGTWSYENAADSTIVSDAIGRVSGLSEGTVETVETGLSFRFSRVSQAKILRTVESAGDGELRYRPDGSVDYVDTLGRDRTSVTLTEDDDRLFGDFDVQRGQSDDRPESRKVNKLVLLGAGEGPGQLTSTATASGFNPSTDREKWGVRRNAEIADQSTLDTVAQVLVDELNSDYLDVETGFRNARLLLGDEYGFDYGPKNVSEDLRAVKVTTRLGNDGRTHRATFSNRKKTRETLTDELVKETRKGGRVIEGFTVPLPVSAGPGHVSPNVNFRFSIPYPSDVLVEVTVNLRVRGLNEYDDDTDSLTGDFPENLDVRVNGSSLGLSIGDGTSAFVEDVDLSGELSAGINTIDLTSDRKARVYAVLEADLYRRMAS